MILNNSSSTYTKYPLTLAFPFKLEFSLEIIHIRAKFEDRQGLGSSLFQIMKSSESSTSS